jgi:antitoxin HicB
MTMTENKTAKDYMALPYTICLKRDEDGDVIAKVTEFEGCIAHGRTAAEALEALKEIQEAWIEIRLEAGIPIPEPEDEDSLPSGKWVQRVAKSLHKKLICRAKKEAVSMNQFCASVLAEGIGRKETTERVANALDSHLKSITEQYRRSIFAAYKHGVIYKHPHVEMWDLVGQHAAKAGYVTYAVKRTVRMMSADSNEIHYKNDQKEISARTH